MLPEMLTTSGGLCLDKLNLLNKCSSSYKSPYSRAALQASGALFCRDASVLLLLAACPSKSVQQKSIKFLIFTSVLGFNAKEWGLGFLTSRNASNHSLYLQLLPSHMLI